MLTSTQLRRLRLAGPLGRQPERPRTSATSVALQSGSQQQLASQAPAFRLHTHVQSNLVQGLRGGARGRGGVSANGGPNGKAGESGRTCCCPHRSNPAAAIPT